METVTKFLRKVGQNRHQSCSLALVFGEFPYKVAQKMGAVRITSLNPKFNGSHFGLPPSSIQRLTGWVANSRIVWRMRTAPIGCFSISLSPIFRCATPSTGQIEKEKLSLVHYTNDNFSFNNNRVLRLPAIVLLNTTFRPSNSGLLAKPRQSNIKV